MQLEQPQSDEEIRPLVEALRRLDPLLDVRWETKAHLVTRPQLDVYGIVSKPAVYEGRWQIIRYETDRIHLERDYAVILTVTAIDETSKARLMLHQGAYAPLGWWVVEYMQRFDAAQNRFAAEMEKVWQEHEQAESLTALIQNKAAHQEAAEKVYREHGGGEYWMGRGFGKGRRSVDRAELETVGAVSSTPQP